MQLKRDTEYAMRIMIYIAELQKENGQQAGVPSSNMIAKAGIPIVSFNRISDRLEEKGLIRKEASVEGESWLYPGSGFWKQSILSIGEAVEGNMKIFDVFDRNSYISQTYGKVLLETQRDLEQILSEKTLESILNGR